MQSVIRQDNGWTVSAGYQSDQFDAVIVATPAHAAAAVLQAADENLSRELGEIQYSSSVTVTLGYDEKVRRSLPPGFGFLVPRSERAPHARGDLCSQQISAPRAGKSRPRPLLFRRSAR